MLVELYFDQKKKQKKNNSNYNYMEDNIHVILFGQEIIPRGLAQQIVFLRQRCGSSLFELGGHSTTSTDADAVPSL